MITPIADDNLNGLKIYITSLEYLKNMHFWFVEFPNNGIEEVNN